MSLLLKVDTYRRLGLINIAHVVWYTFRLKMGLLKKSLPIKPSVTGVFFEPLSQKKLQRLSAKYVESRLLEVPQLFGWIEMDLKKPPTWHRSILSAKSLQKDNKHWSDISDFDSGVGDIKGIWESSRFSWAVFFVQHYVKEQQLSQLNNVNQWIQDWSLHNPTNQGANWKCAQEASLRILHLAACAILLEQEKPSEPLICFITEHLQRIFPTLGYAKAQDNNHGTSEAAALFIGGSWLLRADKNSVVAKKWQDHGRQYLSERVNKLVMPDGSFSQYSATYHRLMLDTLNLVELWRRFLAIAEFSDGYINRVQHAASWLYAIVDNHTGDVPNLGANDGAHILNFANVAYRDFRPSVELAYQLFNDSSVFDDKGSRFIVQLFALRGESDSLSEKGAYFPDGGYGIVRAKSSWCMVRAPIFRFRPGQADCLHLDFWHAGINILRDAGSYSYNTEQKWLSYFSGAEGHNTVQFDQRQAMPKVSRFLYGKWPKYSVFDVQQQNMQVKYVDWKNAVHLREIELTDNQLIIKDTISGQFEQACLRWRLADLAWQVQGQSLLTEHIQLSIVSSQDLIDFTLAQGFESRYYGQKTSIPVLEMLLDKSAQITTTISWQ
tara:strand:- start:2150 stop:3973 length:1824 start_codon:yes stop_codon:yes gene_type:complete